MTAMSATTARTGTRPALQPYEAWYFCTADNVDEVNAEYQRMIDDFEDRLLNVPGAVRVYFAPESADRVTVVAAELDRGVEHVWVLWAGRLTRLESWKVRQAP